MTDELEKRRNQRMREVAESTGVIADADRIDLNALFMSLTIEELRTSYVRLIRNVSRLSETLGDRMQPFEGAIDAAIRILKVPT